MEIFSKTGQLLPIDMASRASIRLQVERKHLYEYQSICAELETICGKKAKSRIWSLPTKPFWRDNRARDALKAFKQSGKTEIEYFIGILRKLK